MHKRNNTFKLLIACLFLAMNLSGQSYLRVEDGSNLIISGNTSLNTMNATIDPGGAVVNSGALSVTGVLSNWAGTGGLLITADSEGCGSLLHYTSNVNATVEQYLESERWHLVAPPITNASIGTYMSIYLKAWLEPTADWEYLVTPTTMPMNATQGYACWASDQLTGTTTVTFEGQLVGTSYALSNLEYTEGSEQAGWNLVGNPYPIAVEWNTDWALNDVGGWALVYDNGTYKGWNPWMPEGERSYNGKTDGFIASTQGFWIRATADNPVVFVPQSARSHQPETFLKDGIESTVCNIHLLATGNGYTDETAILFMEAGTYGFDGLYELEKHKNISDRPNIYSMPSEGMPLAVQVLPENWVDDNPGIVIPIGFELGIPGTCTIKASGLNSFPIEQSIYLEDLQEDYMHDLSYGSYEFYSMENDHPDRFLLHFGTAQDPEYKSGGEILIYGHGNAAYIRLQEQNKGFARIYDLAGREVAAFKLQELLNKKIVAGTGFYIVRATSGNSVTTQKIYISN